MTELYKNKKLYEASKTGDAATVRSCLASGADLNIKYGGCTPLQIAAYYNHTEVVVELLTCQAVDLAGTAGSGRNVLHLACWNGSSDCIPLLGGDSRMTEEVVNSKDKWGRSALMVAVQSGYLACVQEMGKLEGVDWKTRNDDGERLEDVARCLLQLLF
eukprot:GFUD01027777.1.p1 GENE.GFUD01027777.1~~GFUD01027777.1.p1  ORF type:complete len:159 (+),score=40.36 GFUD01027777.1:133-609(+)